VAETGIHFVYAQENPLAATGNLPSDGPRRADDRLWLEQGQLII
jgi:hypothetical protein